MQNKKGSVRFSHLKEKSLLRNYPKLCGNNIDLVDALERVEDLSRVVYNHLDKKHQADNEFRKQNNLEIPTDLKSSQEFWEEFQILLKGTEIFVQMEMLFHYIVKSDAVANQNESEGYDKHQKKTHKAYLSNLQAIQHEKASKKPNSDKLQRLQENHQKLKHEMDLIAVQNKKRDEFIKHEIERLWKVLADFVFEYSFDPNEKLTALPAENIFVRICALKFKLNQLEQILTQLIKSQYKTIITVPEIGMTQESMYKTDTKTITTVYLNVCRNTEFSIKNFFVDYHKSK